MAQRQVPGGGMMSRQSVGRGRGAGGGGGAGAGTGAGARIGWGGGGALHDPSSSRAMPAAASARGHSERAIAFIASLWNEAQRITTPGTI